MSRSTIFSTNHPTLLLIKKRRLKDATGGFLSKISQYSQENTCVEVSFKQKNYQKETQTQMFSCEYWEISKKPILKNTCVRLF